MLFRSPEESLILAFLSRIPKNSDLFHEIVKEIHLTSSKKKRIDISYTEFYRFIQAYDALNSVTTSSKDVLAVNKSFKGKKNFRGRSKARSMNRGRSFSRFKSRNRSFSRRRFKYLVNPRLTGGDLMKVIKERKICNKCGQHSYNGQPCRKIGKEIGRAHV